MRQAPPNTFRTKCVSARRNHWRLYELFAYLAAHGRFDGDEAGEESVVPVGRIGDVEEGIMRGHREVQMREEWTGCGCEAW